MKTRFFLILLLVGTYCTLSASPILEGFWNNYDHNITLEIRETYDGFKAKRTDRGKWFYYKQKSPNRFIDNEGNAYLINDENTIVWEDYYSNKRLSFFRKNIDNRRARDYRNQDNRYRNEARPYDPRAMVRALEGPWFHPITNERIDVYKRNLNLRVRTRRGTATYHATLPGVYEDSRGNKIRLLKNGRLEHFYRGRVLVLERA